ncbi:MAG TPA: SurA N-terminal domain-containing protein [Candidatus Saccharimonadales bacterium]|nr:SurA N-terminal domain-containing protein [Candidatus Saccharimonadales bacterium]
MKKPKKLKKPKLPRVLKRPFKRVKEQADERAKTTEQKMSEALSTVPKITNETVGEHREDVLSDARKYIYPLQHSKHHVVRTSVSLLVLVLIVFLVFCGLSLYKFQSNSGFIYGVTRVIPFPVAKAGHNWVSYEAYLFELRRDMHYYQTQQQSNFKTKDGKAQLKRLKQQAMAEVVQDAYVKQLAMQNHVSVSNKQVDNQISIVRSENRLGSSDRALREVLNEFWGWDESDFKRELKQQLLAQAVVTKLDTATSAKAQSALNQLQGGADFAKLATSLSNDQSTNANGGQYPAALNVNNRQVPPAITAELFKLKAGQISPIINAGYTLEILKIIDVSGASVHAAHIQFNLKPINTYVKPLQAKQPTHYYIKI